MLRNCLLVFVLFAAARVVFAEAPSAAEMTKRLGRGVNLGNALDAPNEGEWGVKLQREHFKAIKDAASTLSAFRFAGRRMLKKQHRSRSNPSSSRVWTRFWAGAAKKSYSSFQHASLR